MVLTVVGKLGMDDASLFKNHLGSVLLCAAGDRVSYLTPHPCISSRTCTYNTW